MVFGAWFEMQVGQFGRFADDHDGVDYIGVSSNGKVLQAKKTDLGLEDGSIVSLRLSEASLPTQTIRWWTLR